MVHDIAVGVLADMSVHQPGFVPLDFAESFLELNFPVARRLDLCAGEHQAGFHSVRKGVVVGGGAVIAQDFDFAVHAWNRCCVKG